MGEHKIFSKIMKSFTFIILISMSGVFFACHSNHEQIPADVVNIPNSASDGDTGDELPVLTFKETTHDFGKVIQGEIVSYAFHFRNTGKSDLVIADVSASCGCTVPSPPKDPILPGQSSEIHVKFNSSNKPNQQVKTITIEANTNPAISKLQIHGFVVPKNQANSSN